MTTVGTVKGQVWEEAAPVLRDHVAGLVDRGRVDAG
jgi:hypothetical protein